MKCKKIEETVPAYLNKIQPFDIINTIFLAIFAFITVYPFIYCLSMSISSPDAVLAQEVTFWPKGFSTKGYELIFQNDGLIRSYMNTVWYVVVGTFFNVILTAAMAYALSRRTFFARKFLLFFVSLTMIFSGGVIPTFLLVNKLGLYNSRWVLVILGLISPWLLLVTRTYIESNIPESLIEAAAIDGCSDLKIFTRMILPLSAPIIAVLTLFYAVGHWNEWFNAMIYFSDARLHPVQMFLRKVLINNSQELTSGLMGMELVGYKLQMKYASIVAVSAPLLLAYPFLQKYFIKGVMVGSIKA